MTSNGLAAGVLCDKDCELIKNKFDDLSEDYYIDYIGLIGNPDNFNWNPEEQERTDKLFAEIKKLANKYVMEEISY